MKKNKTPLTQPLSERELAWLQNYLDNLSQTYPDCMTLEAVDGLFCALIINPVMAKPSEWMNIIFVKEHVFSSEEELEKVMSLLIRYWNHLSQLIEKNELPFPRVIKREAESSFKLAEKWAKAFYIGTGYCRNEWSEFVKDKENAALMTPFFLLDQENDLDNENRETLLGLIPAAAHKLFHYWIEKNTAEKQAAKTKVGRNDPCPCGSGKKYKKCCEGQVSPTIH